MPWNDNVFTRVFGGTKETYVGDPFVRGYGYWWIDLPESLKDVSAADSAKLAALARGVTGLASITLDVEDIEGLGGVRFAIPTKLTMPSRVSVTYMEVQQNFIFNLHNRWINMIRDLRYGTTALMGLDGYTKSKYSGIGYTWLTLPDGETIVEAYVLTGLVPTTLPVSDMGFELGTVGKVDLTIEYAFDHIYFYRIPDESASATSTGISSAFESKLKGLIGEVKKYYQQFNNSLA